MPLEEIATPAHLKHLFSGIRIGAMNLEMRVVYAPLARCRALGNVPSEMAVQYYSGAILSAHLTHMGLNLFLPYAQSQGLLLASPSCVWA